MKLERTTLSTIKEAMQIQELEAEVLKEALLLTTADAQEELTVFKVSDEAN